MSCIIIVSGVTAVGNPELTGSNPAVGHIFYIFSDIRYHIPFSIGKNAEFFRQKLGFFDIWASFLKNYPFYDVTEKKFISEYFSKKIGKILDFPKSQKTLKFQYEL